MNISKIFLYDEPAIPEINLKHVAKFLEDTFRVETVYRENIFHNASPTIAKQLAGSRIFEFRKPFESHEPTVEETQFEIESFQNSSKIENIVLYDGFEFQRIVSELIPTEEQNIEYLHIIFTNKLTCTFDPNDYRYHGRAIIGANPTIISTTGIIEAPAKPREYYLDLMANYSQGLNIDSIKQKYQGRYLEYHDPRICTVVEGYCLQSVFYYITGEPFCEQLDCRLNNAHWQHDLLHSQIAIGKLCPRHEKILSDWIALHDLNC